jgi:serine/threonine-protein phosphatase 6 regulatory ankyrin repeat subunit B
MDLNEYNKYGDGRSDSIYIAALKDDTKYILKYLNEGNDLLIKDERKQSLLHLATRNKARISLELLLKVGLDPNDGDKYNDTPLHIATHMGDYDMTKLLLDAKADPNFRNDKHQTPLHNACIRGAVNVIDILIQHNANIFLVDEFQTSIMQYAVRSKKIKAVKYLVEKRAVINSLDYENKSTMHYAALYSTVDIVTYLMELGVNPYCKTTYKLTPLHLAVEHPNFEMVKLFTNSGLTSYDQSRFGNSPYDEACLKGKYEAKEYFNKLKNDHVYQSKVKANALTLAIVRSDFDLADSLITRSDVNKKDVFGNTPLFYAIMNGESYLAYKLLENNASIYNVDQMNKDALYYAVLSGNEEMIGDIMAKQVDLTKKYLGYTVIEYATLLEKEKTLRLLKTSK